MGLDWLCDLCHDWEKAGEKECGFHAFGKDTQVDVTC